MPGEQVVRTKRLNGVVLGESENLSLELSVNSHEFVSLSDVIDVGKPLLDANCSKVVMNAAVVSSEHACRCTAFVAIHTKMAK